MHGSLKYSKSACQYHPMYSVSSGTSAGVLVVRNHDDDVLGTRLFANGVERNRVGSRVLALGRDGDDSFPSHFTFHEALLRKAQAL